jgi:uncharacterized protein YceK
MKTKLLILTAMVIFMNGCSSVPTNITPIPNNDDGFMNGNVYNDGHQVIVFPEPPDDF